MSQVGPPQPPNLSPGQDAFDAEMMPTGPAPMSGMAVAGFVSSVTICCPVLSPLLGLIFSIVGLAQTKGGARRGRGLAIAGLVISLLIMPLQGWGVPTLVGIVKGYLGIAMSAAAFQGGDTNGGISAWYAMGSPELKAAVTEEEFAKWIKEEFTKLGGLQGLQIDQAQTGERSADNNYDRLAWQAKFPDGTEVIFIEFSTSAWGRMYLEDVIIDGVGLVASLGAGEIESDPDTPEANEDGAAGEP